MLMPAVRSTDANTTNQGYPRYPWAYLVVREKNRMAVIYHGRCCRLGTCAVVISHRDISRQAVTSHSVISYLDDTLIVFALLDNSNNNGSETADPSAYYW